jgi:hypothetical protein
MSEEEVSLSKFETGDVSAIAGETRGVFGGRSSSLSEALGDASISERGLILYINGNTCIFGKHNPIIYNK